MFVGLSTGFVEAPERTSVVQVQGSGDDVLLVVGKAEQSLDPFIAVKKGWSRKEY